MQRLCLGHDRVAVGRLANHGHFGLAIDQQPQALTHDRVVVREQDAEPALHDHV